MRPQGGGKEASVTTYRTIKQLGHPLAMADGKIYVHRFVLFKKIGPGSHPCHWCKEQVSWDAAVASMQLVADHLDEDEWNNDPNNLVPACIGCNVSRVKSAKQTCKRGHPWTAENTYHRRDSGSRQCRACARENDAKRRPPGAPR